MKILAIDICGTAIKLPKLGIVRIAGFRKLIKERLLKQIPI